MRIKLIRRQVNKKKLFWYAGSYHTNRLPRRSFAMTSITGIAEKMQTVLTSTANSFARETGFVQRLGKVTASTFCQTCVLGWLRNPTATLDDLAVTAAGPR